MMKSILCYIYVFVKVASCFSINNFEILEPRIMTQPGTELNGDDGKATTIYGIRHGKSVANEWMAREGNEWGDPTFRDNPSLVDAPLSDSGREQANILLEKLQQIELQKTDGSKSSWLDEIELVIVSPLTRCLQTWEYGCRPIFEQKNIPVIALPLATERVYTASDTGRHVSELQKDFPYAYLEWKFCEALNPWWYVRDNHDEGDQWKEWRPYGEGQWYAVPGEPESVFQRRMDKLHHWLHKRPEKSILMVAHWGVLRHFTGEEVENCGLACIQLSVPSDEQ